MSIQFQSLEGRTMFSALTGAGLLSELTSLTGKASFSSLTGLLPTSHNVLSSGFLSKFTTDLSSIDSKAHAPTAKALKAFNTSINTSFADAKITSGDVTSVNVATDGLLKSQGLDVAVRKSIVSDMDTILHSKMSVTDKMSFLKNFGTLESVFSKLKIA